MSGAALLEALAAFAPEVEEIVGYLAAGADKQALMAAVRASAVAASDAAMQKAAGLPVTGQP